MTAAPLLMTDRATGHPRSPKWPAVRHAWLVANPACALCGGTESVEVHHVLPFHLWPEHELDSSNFLTLCEKPSHNCHFVHGHGFNWSRYDPGVRRHVADFAARLVTMKANEGQRIPEQGVRMTAKLFAHCYAIRQGAGKTGFRRPHAASQPYAPGALPAAYGWPTGVPVTPMTIVIYELGGKFYPADVAPWAAKANLPAPTVKVFALPGADQLAGEADAEVALDWQCAAQAWSYMTGTAANILIVYGPNSGAAFTDCVKYSNTLPNVGAGSWSWGSPEDQWAASDMAGLTAAAQAATYPIMAASGDNDSNDGTNSPDTDAPASLPAITGCGGTSRPPSGPETVWNNGNGEGTGGGFSKIYSRPMWQPANAQGTGRMVPDIAAVADPDTGYSTLVNGQWDVIGGTSASAPLMAGFLAVVNGARVKANLAPIGQANPVLWANLSSFYDITSGNNGTYSATPGPDPCTGLGRALGTLVSAMDGTGQTPVPVPPTPVPPTPVPPVPTTPAFTLTFSKAIPAGATFRVKTSKAIAAGKYACYPVSGAAAEDDLDAVIE